ncbi:MAG TPA: efflux RND transporter periplasmic adaptor subunit [Gemmatimonadales bacterium]|nr:efflux RND transporter periplasmic adaptor subunit [Gemmatimonadales bacterium]
MRRLVLLLALVAACRARASADDESDAKSTTQPAVPAETAVAKEQPFARIVRAIGTVTPRPGHFAELAAPGPTRVAHIFATPDQSVAVGDSLVEFERAPFDAAAQSASTALEAAQRSYARAVRLVQAGILPQKDSDQAAAELAQAQVAAVTARRAQQLATLRAPLAGVVTRMTAVLGASVDASQPLVEIVDPKALDVAFNVSPAEAADIRPGDSVAVTSESAAGAPLGSGTVTGVAAAVDSLSRAVAVRARLSHPVRPPRVGESLAGRIVTAVQRRAVTVPIAALVPAAEGAFQVFVVDSAGVAHARPVTVGGRSETVAEIASGLSAGERVVTSGAYSVADGARIVGAASPAPSR